MKKHMLVTVFASIIFTSFVNADYQQELQEAYARAFDNGITTKKTIDEANMNGEITRIELSKMISNYAIDVLKKRGTITNQCEFSDITADLDKQYDNGVTNACQLGLMGQGISKFRPYDRVTRAEFGTILSRILYGNKYDGGNPYYQKHINQLNNIGIMGNITNANERIELRGNVMIMLKRSKGGKKSIGNNENNGSIPQFEELDNVVKTNCTIIDPYLNYANGDFAPSFIPYKSLQSETVYKRSYILPYKDGYIGYDYRIEDGFRWYYLTYKTTDNPCYEISRTKDIFVWHNDYYYAKTEFHNEKNPDNEIYITEESLDSKPIKTTNCEPGKPGSDRTCQKEVDRYMYNLIIGKESNDYFTKKINKFREDINNGNFKTYKYRNDSIDVCKNNRECIYNLE